jgi:hypothetical protein
VEVTSPTVPRKPRTELGTEVLIRVRKRDFLQRPETPAIVKRDPGDRSEDKVERIKVTLAPKPDVVLVDRPGVKAAMRELWRRTELDEANGDPRGHSLTVYISRAGALRPLNAGIRRGDPPVIVPRPGGGAERRFRETCGNTATDSANDTPLGGIHTHPNPPTPPSPEDHEMARAGDTAVDGEAVCGMQHFVIADTFVMRYTADSDIPLGSRKDVFGE